MRYAFPPDLARLIRQYMTEGQYESEDDVLRDALRALANPSPLVLDEDGDVIEGVRRGLAQMNRGAGRPFTEFDAEFRATRGTSGDA